jgi:hypothetical protein
MGAFKLSGLLLNTEVQDFVTHFPLAGHEFLDSEFFDFGNFHLLVWSRDRTRR